MIRASEKFKRDTKRLSGRNIKWVRGDEEKEREDRSGEINIRGRGMRAGEGS